MTPARAIGMLDRQIAAHGETVVLRRGAAAYPVQAFVRGYRADELVGGIDQGDSEISLSPTALAGSGFALDPVRAGDKITVAGRLRGVVSVEPVSMGGIVVRYNVQVRG